MSFLGPQILKVNGGLGQQAPSDSNVAGLIFANGYEVSPNFVFGEVYKFTSLDEVEAKGLNAASDVNASGTTTALIWYHLSEFFRLNPNGTIYVTVGDDLAGNELFNADGPADMLMAASQRSIRYMGVVLGFDPGATLTQTLGVYAQSDTANETAQLWVDLRAQEFVYVDAVVIEAVNIAVPITWDFRNYENPQVVMVGANDGGYLAEYPAGFDKTGAVGTALGSIGVRMLSESMGSVMIEKMPRSKFGQPDYRLTDTRMNRWVSNARLSNGDAYDDLSQPVKTELTLKGLIYAGRYEGYNGIYLNAESTCTIATDDFNTVSANRVWNESARRIRRTLIPRMNSRVRIDGATGRIKASTIADWDAAAKRELEGLLKEDEIADFTFTLDPNQDVTATGKVSTRVRIVKQGIAKEIEAEVGYINVAQA